MNLFREIDKYVNFSAPIYKNVHAFGAQNRALQNLAFQRTLFYACTLIEAAGASLAQTLFAVLPRRLSRHTLEDPVEILGGVEAGAEADFLDADGGAL